MQWPVIYLGYIFIAKLPLLHMPRRPVAYPDADVEIDDPWHGGLCNCCSADEDCLCVVGACACPCAGYAWNYTVAVQKESDLCTGFLPCFIHVALDGVISGLAAYFSGIPYLVLPAGTLLRVVQRHAVEKESLSNTCVEELFCWGCSIGEVNRKLREREVEHLPPYDGNPILGTLSEPPMSTNSFIPEEEGVNPPSVGIA